MPGRTSRWWVHRGGREGGWLVVEAERMSAGVGVAHLQVQDSTRSAYASPHIVHHHEAQSVACPLLAHAAQVHDVLAMRLNRITLPDNGAAPALPGAAAAKKSYEVDDGALAALLAAGCVCV